MKVDFKYSINENVTLQTDEFAFVVALIVDAEGLKYLLHTEKGDMTLKEQEIKSIWDKEEPKWVEGYLRTTAFMPTDTAIHID